MSDDTFRELDLQLIALLRSQQEAGVPKLYTLSPADAREAYAKGVELLAGHAKQVARVVDTSIGTGAEQLLVRIYYPECGHDRPLPLVVYFHGGGWTFGSIETHDSVCRTLCSNASAIVASIEYRLAPEHKFPKAVSDAITASKWASDNARALGADPERIVLAGDSSGANLAAVAAMTARNAGQPDIFCQLLIYPATDLSMSYPSHKTLADGYRLTRPMMIWSSTNYLRDGPDIFDYRASPLFAENHSGLPPAIIVTAGFDPLKDEGAAYASKLRDAGVEVEYRCFESLIHGFISLTGAVDAAATALDEITLMLKGRLECHS
jgi:acetyl esterase